MMYTGAAA
jgi:hypothetical protein